MRKELNSIRYENKTTCVEPIDRASRGDRRLLVPVHVVLAERLEQLQQQFKHNSHYQPQEVKARRDMIIMIKSHNIDDSMNGRNRRVSMKS